MKVAFVAWRFVGAMVSTERLPETRRFVVVLLVVVAFVAMSASVFVVDAFVVDARSVVSCEVPVATSVEKFPDCELMVLTFPVEMFAVIALLVVAFVVVA